MRRERLYLEDIVAAADAISEFVQARERELFEGDHLLRSALVHQLMVIGEAVAHLSPQLQSRHPQVPWPDIRALRNIIVHSE